MIYIKCFVFYARISYQFKTISELKNGRETGGANSSSLYVLLAWTGMCIYVHICDLHSW